LTRRWRLAGLAFSLASVHTVASAAQTPEALAITGVTVIDTINGRAFPDRTVTIRDRAIVSVVQDGVPQPGTLHVDGHGKFVIPGLWDMHAHHQLTGEASLPLFVANGVTGTRDMGAPIWTPYSRCGNTRPRGPSWPQ
jgi:adenine deaminase